jgi:hypothetical protein
MPHAVLDFTPSPHIAFTALGAQGVAPAEAMWLGLRRRTTNVAQEESEAFLGGVSISLD